MLCKLSDMLDRWGVDRDDPPAALRYQSRVHEFRGLAKHTVRELRWCLGVLRRLNVYRLEVKHGPGTEVGR